MLIILICYLIGSVPFGFIFVKFFSNQDIRTVGSHNIGATNVLRTQGSKKLAFATFLCDALKGTLGTFIALSYLCGYELIFAIISILLGHMFPLWLKFKGGKGISTFFGITFCLSPVAFLISLIIWGVGFKITKISAVGGISSIISAFICTFFNFFDTRMNYTILYLVIVLLIIYKHKDNILRIIDGNEKSFK